jgi:hypothetical protein
MAEVVYVANKGPFKVYVQAVFEIGLIRALRDLKKKYPKKYEQFDFTFKEFKELIAKVFESHLRQLESHSQLPGLDYILVFVDTDKQRGRRFIEITNGKDFLDFIDKYYKMHLKELYLYVVDSVEGKWTDPATGAGLLPSATTYLGVTGRMVDSRS